MFLTLSRTLGLRAFESVHMEPIQVEGGKQWLFTDPGSEAESRSESEPIKPQTLPLPAGQASLTQPGVTSQTPEPREIREGLWFHLDTSKQHPPKSSPTGLLNRPKKRSILTVYSPE